MEFPTYIFLLCSAMMNGAAMNCHQDQLLRSLHRDTCGLPGAGYHLQMNNPLEQNFPAQHSKAINSQSDHFVIDGSSQYLQTIPTVDSTRLIRRDVIDPRSQVLCTQSREPMDLPVPQFEIDTNSVGVHPSTTDDSYLNQNHKNLDLDTRIDLLIKSKALAGMHPIFSELDESADDSDDSIFSGPRFNVCTKKKNRSPSPITDEMLFHKDDNPNSPLSRPPSPFLSKDKYLFWFNKAIELKEQAKAQEQELIKKATKKLLHDNISSVNTNNSDPNKKLNKENKPFFNCLLSEISKEMKEMIKQQFINDVLENTIANTLESWWVSEQAKEEQQLSLSDHQTFTSTFKEDKKNNLKSLTTQKDECVSSASQNSCDAQNHEGLHDQENRFENTEDTSSQAKLSSEEYKISINRESPIDSDTKINSISGFDKSNLDHELEAKNTEETVKINNACTRRYPDTNAQDLLNNITNLQERRMSTIHPKNEENFNSTEGTDISSRKCEKSSRTLNFKEQSLESSDIEHKVSIGEEYSTENINMPNDVKLNFAEHYNSKLSITDNEQRLPDERTQENKIQHKTDETSVTTYCDESGQTPTTSSFVTDKEGIDVFTEEKSSSFEERASTNINVVKEDGNKLEGIIITNIDTNSILDKL